MNENLVRVKQSLLDGLCSYVITITVVRNLSRLTNTLVFRARYKSPLNILHFMSHVNPNYHFLLFRHIFSGYSFFCVCVNFDYCQGPDRSLTNPKLSVRACFNMKRVTFMFIWSNCTMCRWVMYWIGVNTMPIDLQLLIHFVLNLYFLHPYIIPVRNERTIVHHIDLFLCIEKWASNYAYFYNDTCNARWLT